MVRLNNFPSSVRLPKQGDGFHFPSSVPEVDSLISQLSAWVAVSPVRPFAHTNGSPQAGTFSVRGTFNVRESLSELRSQVQKKEENHFPSSVWKII